jgi:hypothetical protein
MSVTLVLRGSKGIPLTNNEVDANFVNLRSAIDIYTASDVLLKLKEVDTNDSGLNSQFLLGLSAISDDQTDNSIVRRTSGGFTAGTITALSFIGPVTGNVTGNVTGTLTGNVIGNATGLSTTLAIGSGGTSAITAAAAKISLGIVTSATGSEIIPSGTTVQRDGTPLAGYLRYNTDTSTFEGYTTVWGSIGGGAGATGASGDQVFQENSPNVTASYTLSLGKNAGSIGPISILSGVTVTIPASKRWVVF